MARGGVRIPGPGAEWAGINLTKHPRLLADNELAWAQDTFQYDPGILSRRQQPGSFSSAVTDADIGHDEGALDSFLVQFIDDKNRYHLFIWCGGVGTPAAPYLIEVNPTTGAFKKFISIQSGGIGNLPWPAKSPLGRPQWTVWRRKLYFFVGADYPPIVIDSAACDSGFASPLPWSNPAAHPGAGYFYQDQMVSCSFGQPNEEALIRICDPSDPTALTLDANSINVGKGDGDANLGLRDTAVLGGAQAIDPYLLVFKQRSIWAIQGVLPTSTSGGSFRIVNLMPDEGCVSMDTVVSTKFGLIWCSGKNVWLMSNDAQKPVAIGDPISKLLRTLPRGYSAGWSASYFDGILRLSVPLAVDYSEMQAYSQIISWNNITHGPIVSAPYRDSGGNPFAFQFGCQFWLDLRRGLENATWWGPMMLPFTSSLVTLPGSGSENLLSLLSFWTPVNTKLIVVDWSQEFGPLFNFGRSTVQLIRFKEIDFGDDAVEKLVDAVELSMSLDLDPNSLEKTDGSVTGDALKTCPVQVGFVGDGGSKNDSWQLPIQITPDAGFLGQFAAGEFVLDQSFLDKNDTLSDKFVSVSAYPYSTRFRCRTFQPQVTVVQTNLPETDPGHQGSAPIRYVGLKLASVGARVRPFGRRPTGSGGSGIP